VNSLTGGTSILPVGFTINYVHGDGDAIQLLNWQPLTVYTDGRK
jgi:hypothetical protein